jgi:hypothetical protein
VVEDNLEGNEDVAGIQDAHPSHEPEIEAPTETTAEIKIRHDQNVNEEQSPQEEMAEHSAAVGKEEIDPTTIPESYASEEPRDDDEYVVISQDEAPMEFAEEYPPIQVSH